MLGNKGFDANVILNDLKARVIAVVIPPKWDRKIQPVIDASIYALRNLVK